LKSCQPNHSLYSLNRKKRVTPNRNRIIGHTIGAHIDIPHGKDEHPLCQTCIVITTVKHIVIHCPNFTEDRIEFHISENRYERIGPYLGMGIQVILLFQKNIELHKLM